MMIDLGTSTCFGSFCQYLTLTFPIIFPPFDLSSPSPQTPLGPGLRLLRGDRSDWHDPGREGCLKTCVSELNDLIFLPVTSRLLLSV